VLTTEPFLLNPGWNPGHTAEPRETEDIRRFHETLPGYAVTPLLTLPAIAETLGLGAVLVKDESLRLGLPAFKMLGASWAVHRALQRSTGDRPRLVTATARP
jgi:diaminopropionate ammonia-lyase